MVGQFIVHLLRDVEKYLKSSNTPAAAAHVVAETGMGRLFGVDRPVEGPKVKGANDYLELVAVFDGGAIAKGLHDALDADVAEIFGAEKK